MLSLLVACFSRPPHAPVKPHTLPVATDPSVVGATCCPIEEGPWTITRLTKDTNGSWVAGGMIGRLWAFDSSTDLDGSTATDDWFEYAERENDAGSPWSWMTSELGWRAAVLPISQVPSAISCDVSGTHDKCQSLVVVTATMDSPSAVLLTVEPDGTKVESDPSKYHQAGQYKVTGSHTLAGVTTTQEGWYFTRVTTLGGLNRNEAWCGPDNWLWPSRATPIHGAVTWDIVRSGNVPSTWPASLSTCPALPGGAAATTFVANSIKL